MAPDSEGGDHRQTEEERFATYLSTLKQRGSAILVVGELPRDCYASFCRKMLGDPASGQRYRLRVTTYEDAEVTSQIDNRISASVEEAPTKHIVSTFDARSAATATSVATTKDTVTHVEGTDLPQLGIVISDGIKEFNEQYGGLDPAELRICFDSLRPLVEEYEDEQVFQFLDLLANRIRSASGMGHFHLPIDSNDPMVHTLKELFDGVIELKSKNNELLQRWQIPDENLTAGWFSV